MKADLKAKVKKHENAWGSEKRDSTPINESGEIIHFKLFQYGNER